MSEKERGGGKWGRGAVLIVLCALVYLLSYDQGRQSVRPQLAELRREKALELEARDREIRRLRAALSESQGRLGSRDGPLDRLSLKPNQSRILFDGRLVVTLLGVDNLENRVTLQLNFLQEELLLAEELAAGGSFRFNLDGRNWALVVGSLSISSAILNLVELKEP